MTKIDIISGFLGAGKTTLIKKLIADCFRNEKIVLVENEFGEIGVDGTFMKEAGIEVSEINSGCICCSLKGDFSAALTRVMETYHPDRILIEPSGVGKLSDVISAARTGLGSDGVLNSFTTVSDVTKAKMYLKNFGEFYADQIASAHTIVLSRTQKVKEDKLNEVLALIRGINPDAVIITTPWDELSGETLLSAMEDGNDMLAALLAETEEAHHHHEDGECDDPDCECHHHHDDEEHHHHHHHEDGECDDPDCECHHHHDDEEHHHHHHEDGECDDPDCECHHHHDGEGHHHHHQADEVFVSWGAQTAHRFTVDALDHILDRLESGEYGVVLRAKGILDCEDGEGWIHFDLTPGEHEIRRGCADFTGRICVIGSHLDKHALAQLFGVEAHE